MGAGSFGMNHPLWDSLSIEMCQLLNQMHILKQYRPALPYSQRVLIIGDRYTLICSKISLLHFALLFSSMLFSFDFLFNLGHLGVLHLELFVVRPSEPVPAPYRVQGKLKPGCSHETTPY